MNYVVSYISILVSLGLLDYIWLGVIMKNHINTRMSGLMKDQIDRVPALGFYVLYSLCVLLLIVVPQSKYGALQLCLLYGLLLGFTAYMTYDLTNRATLKNWPVGMVVPDILWGAVVTGIISVVGYVVYVRMGQV